tara:strand:- start:2757 stop:3665 length:909 start_codon:yes stop_codon:yes gene_type:complete
MKKTKKNTFVNSTSKKLVLGTAQFGFKYGIKNQIKPSINVVDRILDLAYENDIRILDSAEDYGSSLDIISNFHKKRKFRYKIINKIKRINNNQNINKLINSRLSQLGIEKFYAVYFHNPLSIFENQSKLDDLMNLKHNGKIERIGVSAYTNNDALDIVNKFDIDIIQLPFNLLDNNNKRLELFKKLKERKIEIHARSVFLQGLFFIDIKLLSNNLKKLKPYLVRLNSICSEIKIDKGSLALNYVTGSRYVDYVVIGVDNEEQLFKNINYLNTEFSLSNINLIDKINVKHNSLLYPYNWESNH